MLIQNAKTSGFSQTIISAVGQTSDQATAADFLNYLAGMDLKTNAKPAAAQPAAVSDDRAAYEAIREMAGGVLDNGCCWYSFHPCEDIARDYDFIPASEGVPHGSDPFHASIKLDEKGNVVGHSEAPVIPVFRKGMVCRMNGADMTFETLPNSPVLGYFVRKDRSAAFSAQLEVTVTETFHKGRMWKLPEAANLLDELVHAGEDKNPDETVAY